MYDPVGRPVGAANPNGTAAALTYDPAGRVIELTHKVVDYQWGQSRSAFMMGM